jgi:ATP-dependent Clp protease ATP-binding subunit ClpA
MFQRFVEDARQAVVHAQDAARELGHDRITTNHLLIGLARSSPSLVQPLTAERLQAAIGAPDIDREALASIGIDYDAVERSVESNFGPGALTSGRTCGHIPFTPDAKKALEVALRQSLARKDNYVGPEHMLLALLMDRDAAELIRRCGADPAELERRLRKSA